MKFIIIFYIIIISSITIIRINVLSLVNLIHSNESCKPLHLNCQIKHNLNVMACSIDLKYYEILQFNFCCFLSVTIGHYNS